MAALEASSTTVNWTTRLGSRGSMGGAIAYQKVWLGVGDTLYGFDQFSGQQTNAIGNFGNQAHPRAVQPFESGLLVFCSDFYFYKAELEGNIAPVALAYLPQGDVSWMQTQGGSVYVAGASNGLQRFAPGQDVGSRGREDRLDPGYGAGFVYPSPSLSIESILLPTYQNRVDAIDPVSLQLQCSVSVSGTPTAGTSFNGEFFFVAMQDGSVAAVSVSRRAVAWRQTLASPAVGQLASDAKYCYVPLKSGKIVVLSAVDGTAARQIDLPPGMIDPAFDPLTPVAAFARAPDDIAAAAVGKDSAAYTSSWSDGGWKNWGAVSGPAFAPRSAITAASRNTRLYFFGAANDGLVYSNRTAGSDPWRPLAGGNFNPRNFVPGTPLAAVSRSQNDLELYAVGGDGLVYAAWWNREVTAPDGTVTDDWSGWASIVTAGFTLQIFPALTPIKAVAPNPGEVDLFVVGDGGLVYTAQWKVNHGWRGWDRLDGRGFSERRFKAQTPLAALSRKPNQIDLFAVGEDGLVYAAWRAPGAWDFQGWSPIGGRDFSNRHFAQLTPVGAVAPNHEQVNLFAVDPGGVVYTAWWANNSWYGWAPLRGRDFRDLPFPSLTPVAALARNAGQVDVLLADNDSHVYTARWINNDVNWQGWDRIGQLLADPPQAVGGMVEDDGILYGVARAFDRGYSFAVETASLVLAKQDTEQYPEIIGVEDGVLYLKDVETLRAIRPGDLARSFYAEATLMQDFEFANGATRTFPLIHTEISITNADGSAQALQPVRVGATAPAMIESQGERYNVGPSVFATLLTDANGRLRISLPSGDSDANGDFSDGLTCPGLTLFTTFMHSGESIVIRPDAQLHGELSKLDKSALQNAKGYDDQLIVADQYRKNDKAMEKVAQMVNTSFSMVKQSVGHKNRRRDIGERYLANGCDTGIICCCSDGDYSTPFQTSETFAFSLGDEPVFMPAMTEAQKQAWLQAHPPEKENARLPRGFSDFWESVKRGAAQVTGAIVGVLDEASTLVKTVITAVIEGIEKTIELVLDTIEKAALVIQGIFNTIAGSISKVLEALSLAFQWTEVRKLKDKLRDGIRTTWQSLFEPGAAGQTTLFDQAETKITEAFTTIRSDVESALNTAENKLSSTSAASARKNASDGRNAAAGGSSNNWLQSKLEQNLLPPRVSNVAASRKRDAPAGLISFPEFVLPDGIAKELDDLVKDLRGMVTDDVDKAITRLRAQFSSGDGTNILTATLGVVINLLRGATAIVLDVVQRALAALLRITRRILKAMWDYVDQPIEIPFISDLYRLYNGAQALTLLDLGALLVALPTSLVNAIQSLLSRDTRSDAAGINATVWGVAAGVAQTSWALFGTFLQGAERTIANEASWFKAYVAKINLSVLGAVGLVTRLIVLGSDISSLLQDAIRTVSTVVVWAFPTVALSVDIFAAGVAAVAHDTTVFGSIAKWVGRVDLILGAVLGLGGFTFMIVYYGTGIFSWKDDLASLISNILQQLALGVRGLVVFARLLPDPYNLAAELATIATLFVLNLSAGAIKIFGTFWPDLGTAAAA